MQLRSSSISSAPSKATSRRGAEGRESNRMSLRLAFFMTCLVVRMVGVSGFDVCQPAAIGSRWV